MALIEKVVVKTSSDSSEYIINKYPIQVADINAILSTIPPSKGQAAYQIIDNKPNFSFNPASGHEYWVFIGGNGFKADGVAVPSVQNRGAYSTATNYRINSLVTSNGTTYISIQDNNLNRALTNTAWWAVFAAKGDIGTTGANGSGFLTTPTTLNTSTQTVSLMSITPVGGRPIAVGDLIVSESSSSAGVCHRINSISGGNATTVFIFNAKGAKGDKGDRGGSTVLSFVSNVLKIDTDYGVLESSSSNGSHFHIDAEGFLNNTIPFAVHVTGLIEDGSLVTNRIAASYMGTQFIPVVSLQRKGNFLSVYVTFPSSVTIFNAEVTGVEENGLTPTGRDIITVQNNATPTVLQAVVPLMSFQGAAVLSTWTDLPNAEIIVVGRMVNHNDIVYKCIKQHTKLSTILGEQYLVEPGLSTPPFNTPTHTYWATV